MNAVTLEIDRLDNDTSETAFARLLEWLDEGSDSRGERYLEMRRRLVAYFDRRNRPAADMLADETFDRVSRTLTESGCIKVTPPARYCYVVARFVLLEDIRRVDRNVPYDETRSAAHHRSTVSIATAEEGRDDALACLSRCLETLKAPDRELIVDYYRDAKRQRIDRRRELAVRRDITMNALGIRACRLRASLESCIAACRKSP